MSNEHPQKPDLPDCLLVKIFVWICEILHAYKSCIELRIFVIVVTNCFIAFLTFLPRHQSHSNFN